MASLPSLVTVEEFRQLPLDGGPYIHELHYGEVVTTCRPKAKYHKLQVRLTDLMRPRAQHAGVVAMEVPFRAVPQFDLRCADVAFVSHQRWDGMDPEDSAAPWNW